MQPAAGPDLDTLLALFPPAAYLAAAEPVAADEVPRPYRHLLVHDHHMTVMRSRPNHGDFVDVMVLERRQVGDVYSRKILLALQDTGRIVQFGLVRIHLEFCSAAVRAEILAEKLPLGCAF